MSKSNVKSTPPRSAAQLPRATVLLVDDHPANLLAFEAVLEPLHARVIRATSGTEAVEIAAREDLALVLLDLQMPDLDGYETAARLRSASLSRLLPIIIVTALHPSEPDVLRGYASGAVDFLSKPIDPEVLRSKANVFVDLYVERVCARHENGPADSGRQLIDQGRQTTGHAALVDALGRLHAALSGSLDAPTIARRFADEIIALTAAHGASVHYERDGKMVAAFAGELRAELATLDPSCDVLAPVREGHTVLVGDAGTSARARSILAVPIHARGGDVTGALVLVHEDANVFDSQDEDIALVAAHHAGASLDVALLYDEATEARHCAELAELDSRATAARLRLALDATGLGAWEVSPETLRIRCDEACRALLGLDAREDLRLEEFLQPIDERDRERISRGLARALSLAGDTGFDDTFRTSDSAGSERWIAATGRALGDAGRCARLIGTLRDVTEDKRRAAERAELLERERVARSEAEEARARAEVASRVKDEFLATVSHELRTPLNAILGWSHLLLSREIADGDVRHALGVIARNAKAQVRVVDDVLDVSGIVSGKLRLHVEVLDMRRALDLAIESVRPTCEAKEIRVGLRAGGDTLEVIADSGRVQQVLWNLLANAVKFTPRGGLIECVAERDAGSIVVTISDTGIGIEPAFIPHVFDRFRQADGTTTREHGGLGLGLAIVRHLVELQGGDIGVQSEGIGRGSTFSLSLPAMSDGRLPRVTRRSASVPRPPAQTTAIGSLLSGVRALVVEDDDTLRELVAVILAEAGAAVTPAATVTEAMTALEAEAPDLVISDIALAQEDGLALARRIRKTRARAVHRVPMLALTAYARPEDTRRILAAGFDRHVRKPVAPQDLVTIVGELVGRAPLTH
jgi:PAS domain S-box-containing protein